MQTVQQVAESDMETSIHHQSSWPHLDFYLFTVKEKGISSPRAVILQNLWFCMVITDVIAVFIAPYTYTVR